VEGRDSPPAALEAQRHREETEREENVLRFFRLVSTPAKKIAKHLFGSYFRSPSTELRAGKRRWDNEQNLSSPSLSSFKKGCGNFDHGLP
jgi:hypothetical protein